MLTSKDMYFNHEITMKEKNNIYNYAKVKYYSCYLIDREVLNYSTRKLVSYL